jgi:hypothetical protein
MDAVVIGAENSHLLKGLFDSIPPTTFRRLIRPALPRQTPAYVANFSATRPVTA